MGHVADHLWDLATGRPQVDAEELARAVELAVDDQPIDARTKLLIRDSVVSLKNRWGAQRFLQWFEATPARSRIEQVCESAGSDMGFPSLTRRLVDATKPETIRQFLRELSLHVHKPTRVLIGGSIALILSGNLSRHTEDIDLVDEVPADIRNLHELLNDLAKRYALQLTHFQSHYLPAGWERRVARFETFDQLQVFLVDVYDIFLGKLFSVREKDRDDLREMFPRLDRPTIEQRFKDTTAQLRNEPRLYEAARKNWFVLVGQDLPA